MISKIKSNIGLKFWLLFATILILSLGCFAYIGITIVSKFGEETAKNTERTMIESYYGLLARSIHDQALKCDAVFQNISTSAEIIADRATWIYEKPSLLKENRQRLAELFTRSDKNGIFSNASSAKTMVLYWGGREITPYIHGEINALSHLDPWLAGVQKFSRETIAAYFVTQSCIARYYPNVHSVDKIPEGFDIRNANWYRKAAPKNNPHKRIMWSNVYKDILGRGLMITAAKPAYLLSGEFIGAAGVDVTLDTILEQIISEIPSPHKIPGMFIFLLDRQGRIIAFPSRKLGVFGIKRETKHLKDSSQIFEYTLQDSPIEEVRQLSARLFERPFGVFPLQIGGQEYLVASHTMKSTGWQLNAVVPKSFISSSITEMRQHLATTIGKIKVSFIVIALVFVVLSLAAGAMLFYRLVVIPLKELEKGAKKVQAGDLAASIPVRGKDEISSLASSFNSMIVGLKKGRELEKNYAANLEDEIHRKTQELLSHKEELENALESLKKEVDERKRDEQERQRLETQLRQAQKMEAIGTLAGGVAHDFNNLLTTIIGNAELLLLDMDKHDFRHEAVEQIKQAGDRAASLTRQLLAFSRKQMIHPQVLNLNKRISSLKRMIGRLVEEHIGMKTSLSTNQSFVKIDPTQVDQVIMNLVVNARDAMPEGGTLTIETAQKDLDENYFRLHGAEGEPGPYVMISVTDTGVGMDERTRSRIFDPFFTTKEVGKGTGMGLSTVYGIVKQNKGLIWVYSEAGKGTAIKVYLPRVTEESSRAEGVKTSHGKKYRGSETVLIVEDDKALLKLSKEILQRQGYTVLEAQDGEEALGVCEKHPGPIDLLLTDVVMPRMGGNELVKRLRSQRPETKVLYMSGYPGQGKTRQDCLESTLGFIEKPFTPEDLIRKVRETLGVEGS